MICHRQSVPLSSLSRSFPLYSISAFLISTHTHCLSSSHLCEESGSHLLGDLLVGVEGELSGHHSLPLLPFKCCSPSPHCSLLDPNKKKCNKKRSVQIQQEATVALYQYLCYTKVINLLCLALVKLVLDSPSSIVVGNQIVREMEIDWRDSSGNHMIQKFGGTLCWERQRNWFGERGVREKANSEEGHGNSLAVAPWVDIFQY